LGIGRGKVDLTRILAADKRGGVAGRGGSTDLSSRPSMVTVMIRKGGKTGMSSVGRKPMDSWEGEVGEGVSMLERRPGMAASRDDIVRLSGEVLVGGI
jgi:hypothetical protein